jgi:hypothetical protein
MMGIMNFSESKFETRKILLVWLLRSSNEKTFIADMFIYYFKFLHSTKRTFPTVLEADISPPNNYLVLRHNYLVFRHIFWRGIWHMCVLFFHL